MPKPFQTHWVRCPHKTENRTGSCCARCHATVSQNPTPQSKSTGNCPQLEVALHSDKKLLDTVWFANWCWDHSIRCVVTLTVLFMSSCLSYENSRALSNCTIRHSALRQSTCVLGNWIYVLVRVKLTHMHHILGSSLGLEFCGRIRLSQSEIDSYVDCGTIWSACELPYCFLSFSGS